MVGLGSLRGRSGSRPHPQARQGGDSGTPTLPRRGAPARPRPSGQWRGAREPPASPPGESNRGCRLLSQSEETSALGQWPPRMLMSSDATVRSIQKVAAIVVVTQPSGPPSGRAGTEPGRPEPRARCGRAPMAGAAMAEPGGGAAPPRPAQRGCRARSCRACARSLRHPGRPAARPGAPGGRSSPAGGAPTRASRPAACSRACARCSSQRLLQPSSASRAGLATAAERRRRHAAPARPGPGRLLGAARGPAAAPRLVFAPADEPRTVLRGSPCSLGAPLRRLAQASRVGTWSSRAPAEAAPGPAEPERPQGAALERSPSKTLVSGVAPGPARSSLRACKPVSLAVWRKRSSSKCLGCSGTRPSELVGAPCRRLHQEPTPS